MSIIKSISEIMIVDEGLPPNPFDRNNVTPVPANISLSGDGQNDSDELTGTEGLSEGEDESEGDVIEDLENVDVDEDIGFRRTAMDNSPPFDPAALGLKEIGNLASWTVSSSKPGCGVNALRDDDTNLFWQSDGPQPHFLNIHFAKFAKIRAIRIFLDFEADESYTPIRIQLLGGTGYHDLIPFSDLSLVQPKGWIDVNLDHVGGGSDGKTLRAFIVQVKVLENHQNGKDTHIRGLKIYSYDERHESPSPYFNGDDDDSCSSINSDEFGGPDDDLDRGDADSDDDQFWKDFTQARMEEHRMPDLSGLTEPGFMSEPELR
ncbi:hypothetical protein DID88_000443 [Monilinia fructigena]|uniref:DOC domain-containing protein n=1 Tax=Monilinia fructigena TaxID=38457 RepID=A0A395IIT9_9HELO|nr:hypothetical protein DID88_000443 [Monilinia fructigena]